MPEQQNHVQQTFNAGVLSPRLHARTDFERYAAGLKICKNFIPLVQGGARRRSGTRFVAEVADSTKQTNLIPFIFNDVQAYQLQFGDEIVRFHRNQGTISIADTDAAIANGTFDTDLTSWTDRDDGTGASTWDTGRLKLVGAGAGNEARRYQTVTVGAGFQSSLHALKFKVITDGATLRVGTSIGGQQLVADTLYEPGWHVVTFTPGASPIYIEFAEEGTGTTSYVDDVSLIDNAPLSVDSPYDHADVYLLDYAQSADVMWITHRDYKAYTMQRFADTSWSLTTFTPTADPFTTANNYPGAVTLFESRVIFGGTIAEPDTFWGSKSGDYADMTVGVDADDGFKFTPSTDKVNLIQWLLSSKRLLLGTLGEEISVSGGGADEPITPSNIDVDPETSHGSERVRPVKAGQAAIFVQAGGKKIQEFDFDDVSLAFKSDDLTILAEHLFQIPGVKLAQLTYQQEPEGIVWALTDNGLLHSMTYNKKQKVVAWATHIIGGTFDAGVLGDVPAVVEAISVIPGTTNEVDEVWMVVKRTIDDVQKRHIEVIDDIGGITYPQVLSDASLQYNGRIDTATLTPGAVTGNGITFTASVSVFVAGDVGRQLHNLAGRGKATVATFVSGTEVTADIFDDFPSTAAISATLWGIAVGSLTGLSHLEAETVDIQGDGAPYDPQVVSGAAITGLDPMAVLIEVGLNYESELETLRPSFAKTSIQGKMISRADLFIRVSATLGLEVNGVDLPFRTTEDLMDLVPALKTEDLRLLNLNWDRDGFVNVKQTQPLPCEVLAIFGDVAVGSGGGR